MTITEAQRDIRTRFVGGFHGQLVSGGVFIVPVTELRGGHTA